MPIYINNNGTLKELSDVTINNNGTLYSLDTVSANVGGGVIEEVFSKQSSSLYEEFNISTKGTSNYNISYKTLKSVNLTKGQQIYITISNISPGKSGHIGIVVAINGTQIINGSFYSGDYKTAIYEADSTGSYSIVLNWFGTNNPYENIGHSATFTIEIK